jgi:hypothetical protein
MKEDQDHFFRGMNDVRRFDQEISLQEFRQVIARIEGTQSYMVSASYVTTGKSALFKATVDRKGKPWFYLFVPRSQNGIKFYMLTRKPLSRDDEGSIIDLWKVQEESKVDFCNTPRISYGRR